MYLAPIALRVCDVSSAKPFAPTYYDKIHPFFQNSSAFLRLFYGFGRPKLKLNFACNEFPLNF